MSDDDGKGEGELIIYRTDDGAAEIQLRLVDGTVWLTQNEIATLFDTTKQNISLHLKGIFAEQELAATAVVKQSLTTAADGKRYRTNLHNLKAILAVGYRVRSPRGTQFRRWATTTLDEYLVKGFVMNDERLKDPVWDYFDELLERIRDIQASEKRFYLAVEIERTSLGFVCPRIRRDQQCRQGGNICRQFGGIESHADDLHCFALSGDLRSVGFLWSPPIDPFQHVAELRRRNVDGAIRRRWPVGAKLRYLPTYSPDLNPIENAYSKIKSGLRKAAARTVDALTKVVGRTIKTIAPTECAGYFRNAGYRA